MAITATFAADFASFYDAVQKAEVSLKGLETGSDKAGATLNRMANSLSGTKMIQDATLMVQAVEKVGGVSTLTEKELGRVGAMATEAANKLRAMGQDVPPGLQKIADATKGAAQASESWTSWLGKANTILGAFGISLTLGALVAFGRSILEDADALTKMHDKTGISVTGLQAMRIAGDDAGVSLDSMTTAVTMLQKRLGGDDKSLVAALKDLGINIESFKQLDGAGQMSAISDAVKGMHDPLRVANDLSALFGKNWAEILPALKRGFAELRDDTQLTSSAAVKFWDDIGDAITRMWRAMKSGFEQKLFNAFDGMTMGALSLNQSLKDATDSAERAAPKMAAIIPPGLPKDLADLDAEWQVFVDRVKDAAKAAADLKKAEEEAAKATDKSIKETGVLWTEHYALVAKAAGTSSDAQMAAIQKWFDDEVEKLEWNDNNWMEHYKALEAVAKDKMAAIGSTWDSVKDKSLEALRAMANAERATYEQMLTGALHFTREALDEQLKKTRDAEDAARGMGKAYKDSYDEAADAAEELKKKQEGINEALEKEKVLRQQGGSFEITRENFAATARGLGENEGLVETLLRQGYSFQQALLWAKHPDWPPPEQLGPRVPGFAGGVQNFGGGMALVGERGPEIVQLPRHSNVIPSGGFGGGVTVVVPIAVSGIMDPRTRRELAEAVKKEIMQAAMSSRQWGAA